MTSALANRKEKHDFSQEAPSSLTVPVFLLRGGVRQVFSQRISTRERERERERKEAREKEREKERKNESAWRGLDHVPQRGGFAAAEDLRAFSVHKICSVPGVVLLLLLFGNKTLTYFPLETISL